MQPLFENFDRSIVRQLEVVDTSHDTGEIIIGDQRRLARFADDREHGCEIFEA